MQKNEWDIFDCILDIGDIIKPYSLPPLPPVSIKSIIILGGRTG